jgi:hypothetical protein
MHKFLLVTGYQLYRVQKEHGFTDHGGGQLYHNGELVGYMEETDRDEDRIWYDHFVREDFYPHELVKAERERLEKLYKGLKKPND